MKPSEMTNEELAEGLDEVAARLRRPTAVDDDLLKMARDIDRMRAELKVARKIIKGLIEIACDDCKSPWKVNGKCVKCWRVKSAESVIVKLKEV